MTCELDGLQKLRSSYIPHLPLALQGLWVKVIRGDSTSTTDPTDALALNRSLPLTYGQPLIHLLPDTHDQRSFDHPELRVGIVFCGRQSPGGHNIVSGLFDALKAHNRKSVLLGFVGGTEGLFAQNSVEITEDLLMPYRNQGGFDLLGRTKDQIKSTQQVNDAKAACEELKLHALVLIGGCTSCTDAAHLAEAFVASGCQTKVLTAPVTLNGDLKNEFVEANVGFDTVCKVNSQLISNICTDALSAGKYYYFIRLMGRQASQVALECALQSHPNLVVIAEEVSSYKMTLYDVTMRICDVVQERAEKDKYHGVILLPEGLIESIPEVYALIQEIQDQMKCGVNAEDIPAQLSPWASALFEFLPPYIRKEFMLETESDNSAQLSQIETEKLFAQLVETEMKRRMKEGRYKQKKFDVICHFFGYQARGSLPSIFDCDYAYALGQICYHLVAEGLNGYMATLTNLKHSVSQWHCGAAPLTAMMSVTKWLRGPGIHNSRIGKPALHPASVDLKGKAYRLLHENASSWLMDDLYTNPGPIQYNGPGSDSRTISLTLEDQDYIGQIREIGTYLDKIKDLVKPGCPEEVLKAALVSLASATQILSLMS